MAYEDIHRPLTAAGFRGAIKWIVIVSGVMWVVQQFAGAWMLSWLGLVPVRVLREHLFWQPFTYMFLHGSIIHWLFNMLVLWMFGRELEVRWGTRAFLQYVLTCGLGSALCVLLLSPQSGVATIGASGAIFGVLIAFAMVFPEAVIYLYLVVPVKAWQAVALFACIEFFTGMGGGGAGLGRYAHLAGMATGYVYLKSGAILGARSFPPWDWIKNTFRKLPRGGPKPVVFHEVTDELVNEVDEILEKILKNGVESLTPKEKKIMERYSKLKH